MDQKGSKLGGPCSSHSSSLPPSVDAWLKDVLVFSVLMKYFHLAKKKKKIIHISSQSMTYSFVKVSLINYQ